MKRSLFKGTLLMFSIVLSMSTTACSFHHKIRGQVVDQVTGDPIEGASIAIHWKGFKFSPVELGNNEYSLEKAMDTSDKDGYFNIPKYFFKSFYMGVYKKGYVCWDSRRIFLQGEPIKVKDQFGTTSYDVKDRIGFRVRDGMVIELNPFTATEMEVRARHASFVRNTSRNTGGLEGIGTEVQIYRKYYLNKE